MSKPWDAMSPDERNTEYERQRAAYKQEVAHHLALSARVISEATGLTKVILELHAPRELFNGRDWWHCEGCDNGEYADSEPPWPCTTWKTIVSYGGT